MFKRIYAVLDNVKDKLSQKGQGVVEYAVVLAAIVAIAVAALWGNGKDDSNSLSGKIKNAFNIAGENIEKANTQNKPGTE